MLGGTVVRIEPWTGTYADPPGSFDNTSFALVMLASLGPLASFSFLIMAVHSLQFLKKCPGRKFISFLTNIFLQRRQVSISEYLVPNCTVVESRVVGTVVKIARSLDAGDVNG